MPTGAIKIATVNGAPYEGQALAYGQELTFTTTIPKLPGWLSPKIVVSAYQDKNSDDVIDTNELGPDIVFSWVANPDTVFPLGSGPMVGWSIWMARGGGPALARADLCGYGYKANQEVITRLATTGDFPVSG